MSGAAARPFRLAGAAAVIALASFPSSLTAVDCSVPRTTVGVSYGAVFNLTSSGFSQDEIEEAIDYWDLCSGYGSLMPSLMAGGTDGILVQINKINGNSTADGGGCGRMIPNIVNSRLTSAVITVWTHQVNGTSCVPLTDVIAHELGHVYGLADGADSACMTTSWGSALSAGWSTAMTARWQETSGSPRPSRREHRPVRITRWVAVLWSSTSTGAVSASPIWRAASSSTWTPMAWMSRSPGSHRAAGR